VDFKGISIGYFKSAGIGDFHPARSGQSRPALTLEKRRFIEKSNLDKGSSKDDPVFSIFHYII